MEERKCKLCNNGSVEDEIHFFFECDAYEMVRNEFFDNCNMCNVNFDGMSHVSPAKLDILMLHEWKASANYTEYM